MNKKYLKQLDECKVAGCGIERRAHTAAEEDGKINHEFSANGQLVAINRNKPSGRDRGNSQRSAGMMRPSAGGDPILRYLLINKGIITLDELEEAERLLKVTGAVIASPPNLGRVDAAPDA